MTDYTTGPHAAAISKLGTFIATAEAKFSAEDLTFLIPYVIAACYAKNVDVDGILGNVFKGVAGAPKHKTIHYAEQLGKLFGNNEELAVKLFGHLCTEFSNAELRESARKPMVQKFILESLSGQFKAAIQE